MPKIVDKEAKSAEIQQAALRVFARKGFNYTKITDIAREAGIGKGTIYEYFRSKNEILHSAYESYLHEVDSEIEALMHSPLSAFEKIQEIVARSLTYYARDPEAVRIFFDLWLESTHSFDETGINFKKFYADYRTLARQLLDQAIAEGDVRADLPADAPSVLISAIEGTFLQWIIDPEAFSLPEMARAIVDVLIKGLQKR